jgi:hypothetical protein
MEGYMEGRAKLTLQGRVYDGVRVGNGDFQGRTERIVKRTCLRVLVAEESGDFEAFLIGFQDFLGIVHFFFGCP